MIKTNLRRALAVFLVLSLGLVAACGEEDGNNTSNNTTSSTNPLKGDAAAIMAGQTLFQANCKSCHGDDAKGVSGVGPDLTGVKSETDAYIFGVIKDGKGTMPGYGGSLDETKIWQVTSYLQSL